MNYQQIQDLTNNKVLNCQFEIGDIFHEMYSFFVYIIGVGDTMVTTLEGHPSDPSSMKIKQSTKEELKSRLMYSTKDSCWVLWSEKNVIKVKEIFHYYKKEVLDGKIDDKRDLMIDLVLLK